MLFRSRRPPTPLKVLPRAPKEFIGAMPPAFLDVLVAVTVRGAPPAPKKDAAASYAQVAPWLADAPAVRQILQRRFNPPPRKTSATPTIAH